MQAYLLAVAIFGIGIWVAQILPSLAAHVFGIDSPVSEAQWGLLLEASAFTATAAAAGFAAAQCRSVLRALCAIPIAVLLTFLIPSSLGVWLSESFRSVVVNAVAGGVLFAVVGAIAGWSVARFFKRDARHA